MSKRPRGVIELNDVYFAGGHWYPIDKPRMTAREYRAWKRWNGLHRRRRFERYARRWRRNRVRIVTIWDEVSKWQM